MPLSAYAKHASKIPIVPQDKGARMHDAPHVKPIPIASLGNFVSLDSVNLLNARKTRIARMEKFAGINGVISANKTAIATINRSVNRADVSRLRVNKIKTVLRVRSVDNSDAAPVHKTRNVVPENYVWETSVKPPTAEPVTTARMVKFVNKTHVLIARKIRIVDKV